MCTCFPLYLWVWPTVLVGVAYCTFRICMGSEAFDKIYMYMYGVLCVCRYDNVKVFQACMPAWCIALF